MARVKATGKNNLDVSDFEDAMRDLCPWLSPWSGYFAHVSYVFFVEQKQQRDITDKLTNS